MIFSMEKRFSPNVKFIETEFHLRLLTLINQVMHKEQSKLIKK